MPVATGGSSACPVLVLRYGSSSDPGGGIAQAQWRPGAFSDSSACSEMARTARNCGWERRYAAKQLLTASAGCAPSWAAQRASHRDTKAHIVQLHYQGWALNKDIISRCLCGILTIHNFKTFENHLLCKNFLFRVGNIWGNAKRVKTAWFFRDTKLGCNWVKTVRSFCV